MTGTGIIFYGKCYTQQVVSPGTIAGNATVEVTVAFFGLRSSDVCIQTVKPTLTAGIDVGNPRVSATDTLKLLFQNSTASPVAVPSETYIFVFERPENVIGGPDALSGGRVIFN